MTNDPSNSTGDSLSPAVRREVLRRRRWVMFFAVLVSAAGSYFVFGWLTPMRLPSVQRVATDLNVAVLSRDETEFLRRSVMEYRMVRAGDKSGRTVFRLYTNTDDQVIGFAALEEFPMPPVASQPSEASLVDRFFSTYIGLTSVPFVPPLVRPPNAPARMGIRSIRMTPHGLNLWVEDYPQYGPPDENGAQHLVAVRRYSVITASDWKIPLDVSAR